MRVALIDPSLFTLPYDVALASGLRDEGQDVVLYGRTPQTDENSADGVTLVPGFYRFAERRMFRMLPPRVKLGLKGLDHVASMMWLQRTLQKHAPAIIHFQWLPLPVVDGRFLPALRRIAPLVLTVHDTNPFNGNPSFGLQNMRMGSSIRGFDRVIVHTTNGRKRLIDQGADAVRIAVVPHGPLGGAVPRSAADPMTGKLTFLVFGKIKPYKGIDILIEAFSRLPEQLRGQARLRVVGKPYMDLGPLHALASERGVDPGIEPHFVTDDTLPELFGPGTIATFPYREIEASGVLSLALTYRRPILASRIGGFAETITDGEHGALVRPEDPAQLAAAMQRFIEDRAFAAQCAANVASFADVMPSWQEIARLTGEIYAAASKR